MTSYRYPNEILTLVVTGGLVLLVIAISAWATLCGSVLFIGLALILTYSATQSHHQALMKNAHPITDESAPEFMPLVRACLDRLRVRQVQVYVAPSRTLNAYTFGLDNPKVVVLYSALLDLMDEDELRFILGHELGHVALGHTWLNSLVGGMAGIPGGGWMSALLVFALLGWNRACEFSADRAGLIACGRLDKAITALVKLVAGPSGLTRAGFEQAYRRIDAEDDTWLGSLGETLGTHPLLIRRINELRQFAASKQYTRLQS
jgi:Zn-dependent protease with chaperone function